jgi:putative ABC transport system ATP-binding protein
MIALENIAKSYSRGNVAIPVLKGVSLEIEAGQFVAIMGPSGSGKSTLLNIIGCLDRMDSGSYRLDDIDIGTTSDDELAVVRNGKLGFVFQLFSLIPRINARRNVELPLVYAGVAAAERRRRAVAALTRVGLQDRADHTPAQLSGGQQQRVAIARALINEPAVTIADEPTGSLDTATGHDIMHLFTELHRLGKTIVMVTHEPEIAAYAQRIIHLRDGMIEREER